jgi:hypothetical protein
VTLIAIMISLALAHPAAMLGRECVPLRTALHDVELTHPYPVVATVNLDAEQAGRVVEWYNARPPQSSLRYNFAVMIRHQDGMVALLMGIDGLICTAHVVAPEDLTAVMQAILGDPS